MTTFHEADKLDRIFEDRKREGRKPKTETEKAKAFRKDHQRRKKCWKFKLKRCFLMTLGTIGRSRGRALVGGFEGHGFESLLSFPKKHHCWMQLSSKQPRIF